MIDFDENLANKNLNITNYEEKIDAKFDFSTKVMDGKCFPD